MKVVANHFWFCLLVVTAVVNGIYSETALSAPSKEPIYYGRFCAHILAEKAGPYSPELNPKKVIRDLKAVALTQTSLLDALNLFLVTPELNLRDARILTAIEPSLETKKILLRRHGLTEEIFENLGPPPNFDSLINEREVSWRVNLSLMEEAIKEKEYDLPAESLGEMVSYYHLGHRLFGNRKPVSGTIFSRVFRLLLWESGLADSMVDFAKFLNVECGSQSIFECTEKIRLVALDRARANFNLDEVGNVNLPPFISDTKVVTELAKTRLQQLKKSVDLPEEYRDFLSVIELVFITLWPVDTMPYEIIWYLDELAVFLNELREGEISGGLGQLSLIGPH